MPGTTRDPRGQVVGVVWQREVGEPRQVPRHPVRRRPVRRVGPDDGLDDGEHRLGDGVGVLGVGGGGDRRADGRVGEQRPRTALTGAEPHEQVTGGTVGDGGVDDPQPVLRQHLCGVRVERGRPVRQGVEQHEPARPVDAAAVQQRHGQTAHRLPGHGVGAASGASAAKRARLPAAS